MVDVDLLKQRFAVLNVPPFGDCVIVPGAEFDPDWLVELGDLGYVCIDDVLDGVPVTFVQLKRADAVEEASV